MAYDDSMFRRRDAEPAPRDDSEYRAAYRPSHDAGYAPYAPAAPYEQRYDLPYDPPYEERYDPRYDPAARDEPEGRPEPVAGPAARRVAPAVLDDVFDDPEHGEPGRDRLAVHLGWEVVLLLAAGALAFLLYRDDPASLRGAGLTGLLVSATGLGLLTLGAGMTLRAGAVNLAIGPAAVAAALHFAENGDRGALAAVAPALLAGAVLGLAIAVLVGGLQVPGWAASLAGGLGVLVFIQQRSAPVDLQGAYDPATQAWYLFGGMAALAVLGGAVGAIRSVRRAVGRYRPVADPARRRGGLAAALSGLALVASTVLAVGGGVLLAAGGGGPVAPTTGVELTGLAVGAALLGGTSAFGRRGGVFGTLLAVVAVTLFLRYAEVSDWRIADVAVAAVLVAGGLGVTRLVERFGRPASGPRPLPVEWSTTDAEPPAPAWSTGRQEERQESWSSALPAQPTAGRADPWDADRWGGSRR